MKVNVKPIFMYMLLFSSLFTLISKILTPTPIQIFIEESGRRVVVNELGSYTFNDLVVIILSTISTCISLFYILVFEVREPMKLASTLYELNINYVLKLLEGDKRKVFKTILDAGGEILQSELPTLTGFSKSKISRILNELESLGLVIKLKYGMTNKVKVNRRINLLELKEK